MNEKHFRYNCFEFPYWKILCGVAVYQWEQVTCEACVLVNLQNASEGKIDFSKPSSVRYSYWRVANDLSVGGVVEAII
jgi:hypothetical protein